MTGQGNPRQRTVVVGVGNEFRRDDGAGPAVIARLRALQAGDESLSHVTLALSDGEPGRMIDLWEGARLAVVVDAVRDTTMPAGHTCQLTVDTLTSHLNGTADGAASSHGIGLGETVELARVLGRLPARLTLLAVAGHDFGFGTELTAEVAAAVTELVEQVREIVRSPGCGRHGHLTVKPGESSGARLPASRHPTRPSGACPAPAGSARRSRSAWLPGQRRRT
jgi:hydrogenase maturation protease